MFQEPSSPEEHFVTPAPKPTLIPLYPDWLSISNVSCICPFEAAARVTPPHPWITGTLGAGPLENFGMTVIEEGLEKSRLIISECGMEITRRSGRNSRKVLALRLKRTSLLQ